MVLRWSHFTNPRGGDYQAIEYDASSGRVYASCHCFNQHWSRNDGGQNTIFRGQGYTTVGTVTREPEGSRSLYKRMPGKQISTRIVVNDQDEVIGFNMIGSRWNHRILERWILERRTLELVEQRLHEAQFDVEFGRIKLEAMTPIEVTP